ncbi:MAG: sulfotransferase domain-containing protein [Patescibacteria group bacterium]
MNIKYGTPENIAKNLVFIDGLTRSGKTLFFAIIPSLRGMEHTKFFYLLEQILPALKFGNISPEYAKSLLRVHLNELIYNAHLSRNINFRYSDWTGIFSYHNPKLYFERLGQPDNEESKQEILKELRKGNRINPFITHSLMSNLEHLNKLSIDYKMVETYRHPIDNIHSWYKKGYGERFANDPTIFTLSIAHEKELLPWYCADFKEEWLSLNPMEKCTRVGLSLIYSSVEQLKKASNPEGIHLTTYEKFLTEPQKELEKICSFLKTEPTEHTFALIKETLRPEMLDKKKQDKKMEDFKTSINDDLMEELLKASKEYENNLYGLHGLIK